MTYCEKLEEFRQEILAELSRQLPTKHDFIDLIDPDDEDSRENLPCIRIHHKHYSYSLEYVLRVENKDGEIFVVSECSEDLQRSTYDISELTTSELCEITDKIIETVINRK